MAIERSVPQDAPVVDARAGIGRRLRAARKALGLTQGQMADSIGVSRQAYTNWETGHRLVDVLAAIRLKERHGISLDWIYAEDLTSLPFGLADKIRSAAIRLVKN